MIAEERARLVIDPDTAKAREALQQVINQEKKVGDQTKQTAAQREKIEKEFSDKAFEFSNSRVKQLKKEFQESLDEAKKYGANRASIDEYYTKQITKAQSDALAAQGDKIASLGGKLTLGITTPLVAGAAAGLKFAASMETSAIQYGVLLKDTAKGLPFVNTLKELAAQTPLAFAGIDAATKSLLGYGVQADKVVETIRMLGDLAMGNQEKLQSLALAYGQIMSLGKANLQDLKQLVNAGVPIFEQLSKQKGKSIAEIQEMVSAGKIGAGEVQKALVSLTAEGGIFHGMMQKMATTAEGRLSTALDDLKDSAASLMEDALPLAKDVLEYLSAIAGTIKELDDTQKKALLTALGVAAVSGPVLTVTGNVMKLVAAWEAMDRAAAAAKLTALAANPTTWVVAAGVAIVGAVAGITAAEKAHTAALKEKVTHVDQSIQDAHDLATEYQTLANKGKLSAEQEERLDELAKSLKEKYPGLTEETIKLAAANGKLAEAAEDAALAESRKAAAQLLPKQEADYRNIIGQYNNYKTILEKVRNLKPGETYLGKTSADVDALERQVKSLYDQADALFWDIYHNKALIYNPPKYKIAMPDIDTGGGAGGLSDALGGKLQGNRLSELDKEYDVLIKLAETEGKDTNDITKEWLEKRSKLIKTFVQEDQAEGKTLEYTLSTPLKGFGLIQNELDTTQSRLNYVIAQIDKAKRIEEAFDANEADAQAYAPMTAAEADAAKGAYNYAAAKEEEAKRIEEAFDANEADAQAYAPTAIELKTIALRNNIDAITASIESNKNQIDTFIKEVEAAGASEEAITALKNAWIKYLAATADQKGLGSSFFGGMRGAIGEVGQALGDLVSGLEKTYELKIVTDESKAALKEFFDANKEGISALASQIEGLYSTWQDSQTYALQAELDALDKQISAYDKYSARQLALLQTNGADTISYQLKINAEKERLDKEREAKEYKLKKREFEIEKQESLLQIAISTAQGMAAAYKSGNPLIGSILAAAIFVAGGAQAAIVASKKYPAAYEGAVVKGSSEGALIRAGERYQEEAVVPLRRSKLQELGLTATSQSLYIGQMQFVLPKGTSREQAMAIYKELQKIQHERLRIA